MTFGEILDQAIEMLQRRKRVSYRALKLQFKLDNEYLEVLRDELIKVQQLAVDQDGEMLVWTGEVGAPGPEPPRGTEGERHFQLLLPAVILLLQLDKRVTYRTLKWTFGLDDALVEEIRKELSFRQIARDEQGEGLVWTGEMPSVMAPVADSPSQATAVSMPLPVTETRRPSNGPTASPEAISTDVLQDEPAVTSKPTRTAPEAERRQLTVMFCDIVGSTDLSTRLDPEDLREVVRAFQETVAEVIQRYEGHISQYLGDGLLVYQGWPQAHENDAERAVYTGLEIPEAIARLNTRLEADYGVRLAVRIGIHTGPVVVGEMGGGGRHENLALGETPNISARLEGLAQPNTVVISPATAQLVRRSFVLEELGLHDLKGVSEPMLLYTVVGSREPDYDDHEEMLSGGFDALVGRDEEIGLLLRRWEQSKDGQGQVVLISGEAGLGKSSLVEGLRAHVHKEGYTRIAFRCSPYTANSALHPVIEHVQRVLGWQRDDTAETRLDKLEQALKPTSLPIEETVPLFAALLSLPVPEERYPALTLSPQRQRQLTQDALVAWMLEEAEHQPMLAVWEDLHWADPSTLELLGLFIEQTPTAPMLNVLAFRPEFVPPWPTQSHMTPITLNRLERIHIEALVHRLAGGKILPTEVVDHIVGKTDGVPLYVEELTKMLLESDLLEEESEQYILTGSLSSASIPATLQDSLMARLDSLPSVKEVAQLGAVLGREFDYEMLQALHAIDEPTLQAGLSQLVGHELLYQRGRIPRAKFIFRHALIRDAAYASLLRRTRQAHHQQVARLLESQFPDVLETQPELVAHHYREAGLNEQAVGYWQQAGQRAIVRSAYAEAIAHLTQGLAALTPLRETPVSQQQELDLQVALGSALSTTQGNASPDVERAYARAQELCKQLGDSPQLFEVLRGLAFHYASRQGQKQRVEGLAERLLSLAQSQPDPSRLLIAHYTMGQILYYWGEQAKAQPHYAKALAIYQPQEHRHQDTSSRTRIHLARVLWLLGYPDQAVQHSQVAYTLVREVPNPHSQVSWRAFSANLHQFRRDASQVYEQVETALTLATEQGFAQWVARCQILLGWALAMQEQSETGIAKLQQGLAAERVTGSEVQIPYFLGLLAEAYQKGGHIHQGLNALTEALATTDATETRFYEAELNRIKGQLLLQQSPDNATEAENCFQQAITIAQSQSAKSWELRASTSLARLWQSQGKRDEARELLGDVYGWFSEGFDTADLIDAKALIDELEGSR